MQVFFEKIAKKFVSCVNILLRIWKILFFPIKSCYTWDTAAAIYVAAYAAYAALQDRRRICANRLEENYGYGCFWLRFASRRYSL